MPRNQPYLVHDLIVRLYDPAGNLIEERTMEEDDGAGADRWINWNILWWHSGQDSWRLLGLAGADDDTLHPWYGYLVWANTRDLTLIVPAD